jgi:small subunit ribosomal protein S35
VRYDGIPYGQLADPVHLYPAQTTPFIPPTSPIRITTTHDLARPDDSISNRQVALIPVAGLPLETPEAIHRFKLLAGRRWTPGRPGVDEIGVRNENYGFNGGDKEIGREGWLKIAEERFGNGRMNRKGLSDILERLVEAANVSEVIARGCGC